MPRLSDHRARLRWAWSALVAFAALSTATGSAAQLEQVADRRPNIILILADDLGYSDVGAYGGEIATPNLDRLAAGGVRFTAFYNSARCSPTRASLLTGLHPHQVGMGHLAGALWIRPGHPGYLGRLNERGVTIAEVLRGSGYRTFMVGKWHLGNRRNDVVPWTRGFDRYFGRLYGPEYRDTRGLLLDGERYTPTSGDFHLTDAEGEFAARFIEEHERERPGSPYFLYLAFHAPHWPLQPRADDLARYRGRYLRGWDELRRERYARMVGRGLVSARQPLPPRDPAVPAWSAIGNADRPAWDLKMAAYAAQVTGMDRAIGRVLEAVRRSGEQENTLIMFLSDNGASAERVARENDIPPDRPGSFMAYHMPWAHLSGTPFRMYKHWVHEGGIATPLIVSWPARVAEPGSLTGERGHVIDIMATALDAAGASYPRYYRDQTVLPLEGKTLLPVLTTGSRPGHDALYWEHEGHRALREGQWKLVSTHPTDDWLYERWGFPRDGFSGEWELYDLSVDPFEQRDLAREHPDRVRAMSGRWSEWARRTGVRPWSEVALERWGR